MAVVKQAAPILPTMRVLRQDRYDGPKGQGTCLVLVVAADDATYLRTVQYGPEVLRETGWLDATGQPLPDVPADDAVREALAIRTVELKDARARANDLEQQTAALEKERDALQVRVGQVEGDTRRAAQYHTEECEAYERELTAIRAEAAQARQALATAEAAYTATLQARDAEHAQALADATQREADARAAHTRALEALKAEHAQTVAGLTSTHQARVADLQARMDATSDEAALHVAALVSERAALRQRVDAAETTVTDARAQVATARQTVERMQDEHAARTTALQARLGEAERQWRDAGHEANRVTGLLEGTRAEYHADCEQHQRENAAAAERQRDDEARLAERDAHLGELARQLGEHGIRVATLSAEAIAREQAHQRALEAVATEAAARQADALASLQGQCNAVLGPLREQLDEKDRAIARLLKGAAGG